MRNKSDTLLRILFFIMLLEIALRFVGLLLLALGLAHVVYPTFFDWKVELQKVSLWTRQVFYSHEFFVAFTVVAQGALCLFWPQTLVEKSLLARLVLSFLALFWLCRLAFQFLHYDRSLWRGNRPKTLAHWVFSILWSSFTGIFAWTLWQQF